MKRKFLKYVILLSFTVSILGLVSCAPEGYLVESRTDKIGINSKVLGKLMILEIHIPIGYDADDSIPVLYLLHDYADQMSSIRNAGFFKMVDILTEQGLVEPMLIVAPQIDNSYLLNSAEKNVIYGQDGITGLYSGLYEDYFINEVMKYIEASYGVMDSRDGRYIGGISAGGYAALRMAFANPDLFSKVGAHMPALWTPDMELMQMDLLGWYYPDDEARLDRDPVRLAKTNDLNGLSEYMDCGEDDWYSLPFVESIEAALNDGDYTVEVAINSGKHDFNYIVDHVTEYLMFYGAD